MIDVAKNAGVSVATVDRVLNRRAPVRQATAQRILKAAQELQYYASPLLRSYIQTLRIPVRCAILLQRRTTAFYQTLASTLRQKAHARPEIGADLIIEFVDAVNSTAVADRMRNVSPQVDALALLPVVTVICVKKAAKAVSAAFSENKLLVSTYLKQSSVSMMLQSPMMRHASF